jgi:hypothetical protein
VRGGATRFVESPLSVSRLLSEQLAKDTLHNAQCRQTWRTELAREETMGRGEAVGGGQKHFGVSRHLSA